MINLYGQVRYDDFDRRKTISKTKWNIFWEVTSLIDLYWKLRYNDFEISKQFQRRNGIYFRSSSVWSIYIGISGITILIDPKQFQKRTEIYFRNSPVWSNLYGKLRYNDFWVIQDNSKNEMKYILWNHQFEQFI